MRLVIPALIAGYLALATAFVLEGPLKRNLTKLDQAQQREAESLQVLEQAHQREIRSLQSAILVATQTGHLYGQRFILMKMNGGNAEPWSEETCLNHIRESFHLTNEVSAK